MKIWVVVIDVSIRAFAKKTEAMKVYAESFSEDGDVDIHEVELEGS